MPSGKKWKYDSKLLFLSMISNNFFCNDKDVINQLTEEQLKLTKIREWNSVNWYKLYNVDNRCESYVITQRIICFIPFLISRKEY